MNVYNARDLGAAARQKRETLGLTQQALANAAGVSREWLLSFESGKPGVSLSRVFNVLNT
ncbi:MAG TPA: XRE family transcriptional regulator, partial [Microbacteriaceae bacterium]|nr:XRE family transcriptional regulator [Microbacteriaceae bacterium]